MAGTGAGGGEGGSEGGVWVKSTSWPGCGSSHWVRLVVGVMMSSLALFDRVTSASEPEESIRCLLKDSVISVLGEPDADEMLVRGLT